MFIKHIIFLYLITRTCYLITVQVNEQLSPVWSTFLTISLKKQYTQFNSAHNMSNTSDVATLSVIALN